MIYGSISRRYAKALFTLGEEKNILPLLVRQIESFHDLWSESSELRGAMTDPTITGRTRRAIIEKLASRMGMHEAARRFLLLLAHRRRMESLHLILLTLKSLADKKAGVVRGTISSAFPLDEQEFSFMVGSIERKMGRKVILGRQVDPDLIGGFVIAIEDMVIDGSVRSYLDDARKKLTGELHP